MGDDVNTVDRGDHPVCVYTAGVCGTHGTAEKLFRPSRVWARGKNGTFGWKYSKVTYYSCRKVTQKPKETLKPTFIAGKRGGPELCSIFHRQGGGLPRGKRGLVMKQKEETDRK